MVLGWYDFFSRHFFSFHSSVPPRGLVRADDKQIFLGYLFPTTYLLVPATRMIKLQSLQMLSSVRFLDLECSLSILFFLFSRRLALGSMMDYSHIQCFVSESSITVLRLCSLDFLLHHARMEFLHLLAIALWNC